MKKIGIMGFSILAAVLLVSTAGAHVTVNVTCPNGTTPLEGVPVHLVSTECAFDQTLPTDSSGSVTFNLPGECLGAEFTATVNNLSQTFTFPAANGEVTRTFAIDSPLCAVPCTCLCCEDGTVAGQLVVETLPDGNIKVTFIQSTAINDNTYGANAIGWPHGHKFKDLVGSDQAGFLFLNADNTVALKFKIDYISKAPTSLYPSGFGSLGVSGGDGAMLIGNPASIVAFSTSLTENLNKHPFVDNVAEFTVNSPSPADTALFSQWEVRDIYSVVVDKGAFDASGFGSVSINEVHNSPSKTKSKCKTPTLCPPTTPCPCNPCNPLASCTPPYPFTSSNPLTSIPFRESEVLRAFMVGVTEGCTPSEIRVFYNDEHALILGVRRMIVRTSSGFTVTDFPVSPLPASPSSVLNPAVGSPTGTDPAGRPIFPALFITDITDDPTSLAGDWQFGGTPIPPDAVFGTWKAAVELMDMTKSPPKIQVMPDKDPKKNNWNLDGGDPVPAGLKNQGFGAEVRWDISSLGLTPGRTYRLYFMVHDGDQNKTGGDVGQGCAILTMPE